MNISSSEKYGIADVDAAWKARDYAHQTQSKKQKA
jgi:hypothetical protein